MKNKYHCQILLYFLIFGAFVIPSIASNHNTSIPDSLLTKDYIYEFTFSDQEKAKRIIGLMRDRKLEPGYVLDIAEGDLYFNNGKYNEALIYYTRALNSDSVRNNNTEYMEQLHRMISCYDCLHDEVKKTEYVKLLLKKAEDCGNKEMRSVALFNMGKMVYYQEDKERGYQIIKEAITEMKLSEYKYKYDNLRYNYHTLLIMQQRDKRYEEALKTLDELEKVVAEATSEEPGIDGLFEKEMKTMYAQRAVLLSRLNRMEEADKAYRQWEAIGKAYTKDDYLIIPYLMDRKLFDKVIEMYTPREAFLREHNDTINYHMMTVKRSLGKAYEGKKDYPKAIQYFKELAILTDSLKVREQQSAALELATQYETHQKEVKLQEHATRVKINNILLLSAGVAIIFLIILLWHNKKYTRTIRLKNKVMIGTIEDLMANKEELFEAKEVLSSLKESKSDTGNAAIDKQKEIDTNSSASISEDDTEDRTLFDELDAIVTREKLFLSTDLSREDLMKLIHVNKNRFGQIMQQCTGNNTTTYINNKRLEYAVRMLKKHPEYTIAAIAELCGVPNIPTFNRLFRAKFSMTPTEFREGLNNTDNK